MKGLQLVFTFLWLIASAVSSAQEDRSYLLIPADALDPTEAVNRDDCEQCADQGHESRSSSKAPAVIITVPNGQDAWRVNPNVQVDGENYVVTDEVKARPAPLKLRRPSQEEVYSSQSEEDLNLPQGMYVERRRGSSVSVGSGKVKFEVDGMFKGVIKPGKVEVNIPFP